MSVMASAATVLYPHISKKPEVCGGKACIDGTRIRVMDIVALHTQGHTVEEMLEHFDSRPLTPAEVYSALAYYHDHKEEIEASFAGEEKAEADHETRKAEYLNRRSGR
jgi:uncharacterized protein (DUF433 family)